MTSLPRNYIRLPDGTIEPCDDERRFIQWYNEVKNRRILRTAVPYGDFKKAVIVETRFTGHGSMVSDEPDFFETFAKFPHKKSTLSKLDATEAQARETHRWMVAEVEEELAKNPAYREFSKGLEEVLTNPGAMPVPRPRQAAAPHLQAPKADCPKCHGSGKIHGVFETLPCDCTIVTT